MRTHHTDLAWSYRWHRDMATEVDLSWTHERQEWQQRCRHDQAGWTDPVVIEGLAVPEDEETAREVAEGYATK